MRSHTVCAAVLLCLMIFFMAGYSWGQPSSPEKSCPALESMLATCEQHRGDEPRGDFVIPRAWMVSPLDPRGHLEKLLAQGQVTGAAKVERPYVLYAEVIKKIFAAEEKGSTDAHECNLLTGKGIVAVNALPRLMSMYDLDGDGLIGSAGGADITLNAQGTRETGTFARNILVLPYLKALGYTTIHFQPITEIGVYGRKGNLGSPFAIRDPFTIDPNLADPLFPQSAAEQYRAFIEAAHAMGMKVVQEVIPRTLSIDSTILEKHPQYGYWVKAGTPRRMPEYYSPSYQYPTDGGKKTFRDRPSFEKWFYNDYKKKIYGGTYTLDDLIDVTKTDPEFASWFLASPDVVKREADGRLTGYYYARGAAGKEKGALDESLRAEVFPAFCDTPFEIQPFWQDVTYLRLYANNDGKLPMLNALSFVTAKFFKDVEPSVERRYRNEPVWKMITGYFGKFKAMGVDGFVLDMGHALPDDLKKDIRKVLPLVWEENLGASFADLARSPMIITGKAFSYCMPSYSDSSEMKKYEDSPRDALSFYREHTVKMCREVASSPRYKGRMFGFPENYNTKRIGQTPAARILARAPFLGDTAVRDFTCAPVDPVKARRIALMYYELFRVMAAREGSPFLFNAVFASEFVPSSTINVGLSTHIKEARQFYDYMTPEERKAHPDAPKLLLFCKPDRQGEEWTSARHFIGDIVALNKALEKMKSLLAKNQHLVVKEAPEPLLFLSLQSGDRSAEKAAVLVNLDLERDCRYTFSDTVKRYYYRKPAVSPEAGRDGAMVLPPGGVTILGY
ncbi:MAG: hypothetical protein RDV48_00635 [Candidatus Eremiobacteraeota bacterium]|nr:hypothetical protein [Candidatus Eremiobacteraeota bacterium]